MPSNATCLIMGTLPNACPTCPVGTRTHTAFRFGDLEWQPHPLKKQRAEQHGLHLKLQLSRWPVKKGTRTWTWVGQVGLVSSRRLWQHHGLPMMVLGRKRRMMKSVVESLSRFREIGSDTCRQCLPTGSAHESAPIQITSCPLSSTRQPSGSPKSCVTVSFVTFRIIEKPCGEHPPTRHKCAAEEIDLQI